MIMRKSQGQEQVLLVKDHAKIEISTGFSHWMQKSHPVYSLPGGGRAYANNGQSENLSQTLTRELSEELELPISLDRIPLLRQAFPFIAGQLSSQKVNEFAVTSAVVWYDFLPREVQKTLEQKMAQETVAWWSLLDLVQVFRLLQYRPRLIEKTQFTRPQTLTAAWLWHLELVAGESQDSIKQRLIPKNHALHGLIYDKAASMDLPVNNGCFTNGGDVKLTRLTQRDRQFLFGENFEVESDQK